MADSPRTQEFTEALRHLEEDDDTSRLVELFAESAEMVRPESDLATPQDVEQFWRSYRDQFSVVSTEFTVTQEGSDHATLEWHSKGQLSAGRDIEYDGVSILTYGDDDKVSRFATYFDSAAFLPAKD